MTEPTAMAGFAIFFSPSHIRQIFIHTAIKSTIFALGFNLRFSIHPT